MVRLAALVLAAFATTGSLDSGAPPRESRVPRVVTAPPGAAAWLDLARATVLPRPGVESTIGEPAARLTIARLQYDGGGDWYANPSSLPNLLTAIAERTTLKVERTEARTTLMDDRLWDYPFLHVTGHGNIHFSDAEVVRLREYLARGGFLHVDDNYGLDESFRREIARVYPDRPLVDVPLSHPIYHIVYDFRRAYPRSTSTTESRRAALASSSATGSRCTTRSHPTWVMAGKTSARTPIRPRCTRRALRMGVNLFVYAVTSRPTA